jgi:dihydroorotase-like cyclic amidohydrolase
MNSSVLIQSALLHDINHPLNGQRVNILVENGFISEVSTSLISAPKDGKTIEGKDLFVTGGWFDAYSFLPDPGEPWK